VYSSPGSRTRPVYSTMRTPRLIGSAAKTPRPVRERPTLRAKRDSMRRFFFLAVFFIVPIKPHRPIPARGWGKLIQHECASARPRVGSAGPLPDEVGQLLAGHVGRKPDEQRRQQQERKRKQRQAGGDRVGGGDPAHDQRCERGDRETEGERRADAGAADL